jgi:hypothetical protein
MAPKIGPRGITIQDVQDVVNNGSKAGKSQYVYAPATTTTATTPVDYAALLAGGPASTYGQKYGGQSSAEYAKQMILGAAMQNKSIGDLAAMQAATAQQDLTSKFASDLRSGTNKLYPTFRSQFAQPLTTTPGTRNYVPGPEAQSAQQLGDLERQLNDLYVTGMGNQRVLAMGTDPAKVRELQNSIDQAKRTLQYSGYSPNAETLNAPRSQAEAVQQTAVNKQNAYGAYMNRMNMLDTSGLSSSRNTTNEGTASVSLQPGLPSLLRGGAQRQTATNLMPGFESSIAQQVTPYENVAAGFANTPLSEFAQQIAVNRYGYDPALAQGLFDTSVDVNSLKDQADYFAAQHPELNMSPAEIVYQQFGQDGLDQYNAQQAQQALYGTPSQQTTADQAAQDAANAPIDAQLYSVYGYMPKEISGPTDLVRQVMSDSAFTQQFNDAQTQIYNDINNGKTANDAVGEYMRNYLQQTGDPLRANILNELLSNISFA